MKTLMLSLFAAATLTSLAPAAVDAHDGGRHAVAPVAGYTKICHVHRGARHCHVVEGRGQYVVGPVVRHSHRGLVRQARRQQRRYQARRHHDHAPEVNVPVRESRRGGNVTVRPARGGNVTVVGPTTRRSDQRRRTQGPSVQTRRAPVVIIQPAPPADEQVYRAVHEGNSL